MTKTNYLFGQFFKRSLVLAVILLTCASAVYAEANTYSRPTSTYVKNSLAIKSVNYKTDKPQSSTINPIVHLLNQEYEFIFFYESGCGYCIEFAPILKKYAGAAGIKVIAFALGDENKAQPLFANSTLVDQNTVAQFFGQGVKISTPTLFIWNKRNGHVYPVARGMHTYEELDFRMNELAPKILKKELEYR